MRGIAICCLIVVALLSCISYGPDVKFNKLTRDFYSNPSMSEHETKFKNYSLEEQYDLFIFGNQVVHPPATYLADIFAKQGSTIVPFLKAKLKTAQYELTIRDIILIFESIARLKLYDFSKDQELMGLMDERAQNMRGIWKDVVLAMISEIRAKR